jgi:hypothetical protein
MTGGVYHSGRCYSSTSVAIDAAFSSVVPSFNNSGCLVYLSKDSSVWRHNLACPSQAVFSLDAPVPLFLDCDPLDSVSDGFLLAFAVVGVWVAAWSFKVLARSFYDH